jgi:prepilin-type processing-associated H-X9-DG protein
MSEIRVDTISEKTSANGVTIDGVTIKDGGITATTGTIVFNEASADVDFRVESNGNANMLFVDGGNNRVGIGGTDASFGNLGVEVAGDCTVDLFSNVGSGTAGKCEIFFSTDSSSDHVSIASIVAEQGSGDEASRKGQFKFNVSDNGGPATALTIFNNRNLQAATGISFGSDTAATTVLDDYEEGNTSDLTLSPGTSGSISLQDGFRQLSYTKIGRMVTITGILKVTSVSSPTGAPTFNLPFVVASNDDLGEGCRGHGYVVNAAAAENGDGGLIIEAITAGSASCTIFKTDNTTNGLRDFDSTFATSQAEICFSFSYFSA